MLWIWTFHLISYCLVRLGCVYVFWVALLCIITASANLTVPGSRNAFFNPNSALRLVQLCVTWWCLRPAMVEWPRFAVPALSASVRVPYNPIWCWILYTGRSLIAFLHRWQITAVEFLLLLFWASRESLCFKLWCIYLFICSLVNSFIHLFIRCFDFRSSYVTNFFFHS